jgi:hypothetical protein
MFSKKDKIFDYQKKKKLNNSVFIVTLYLILNFFYIINEIEMEKETLNKILYNIEGFSIQLLAISNKRNTFLIRKRGKKLL